MTTTERVHQLGPIRDYADYLAAKQDLRNLQEKVFELDHEEYAFVSATQKHVELFESYLELDCAKPQARDLLAYLIQQVKPVSLETLENETGLTDIATILSGHRAPTAQEAQRLTEYFAVSEDAFV